MLRDDNHGLALHAVNLAAENQRKAYVFSRLSSLAGDSLLNAFLGDEIAGESLSVPCNCQASIRSIC